MQETSTMATLGIVAMVFAAIFIFLGLIFGLIGYINRRKAKAASAWNTATGQVTSTEVRQHESIDEDSGTQTSYEPVVRYAYTVNGQVFEGKRLGFGANQFDRNTANKKLAPYQAGGAVTVYYNPANPSECALDVSTGSSKTMLVVGIVLGALGLVGCCLGVVFVMMG